MSNAHTNDEPAGSRAANIVDLRRLLAERFPAAHGRARGGESPGGPAAAASGIPTGVPALDTLLGGGLQKGELTELVGTGPGSGTAQVLHAMISRAASEGRFLALIDGADSYDPDAAEAAELARLLWVRCRAAEEALKAVDLVLRDRNFPLAVLDLKLNPAAQLRRIPSSVWHRLERIAEHQGTTLLVVTPFPLVGSVSVRVEMRSGLGVEALALPAEARLGRLHFEPLRMAGSRRGPGAVDIGHPASDVRAVG